MLKAKEYTKCSLNDRIKKAVENHMLTTEMGTWADDVPAWTPTTSATP